MTQPTVHNSKKGQCPENSWPGEKHKRPTLEAADGLKKFQVPQSAAKHLKGFLLKRDISDCLVPWASLSTGGFRNSLKLIKNHKKLELISSAFVLIGCTAFTVFSH